MQTLTQGQRLPVTSITTASEIQIGFEIPSDLIIDLACFGLDAQDRLSDDRYMVFFNQPGSPCGAIRLSGQNSFSLVLSGLPDSINKLVFTAAVDGNGTMSQIRSSQFQIGDADQPRAACAFSGSTFQLERAIMLLELYRKDGSWRLNSILQGFNDGLDALVRHFGGEVAEDSPAPPVEPAPAARVSLEKKIAAAAPELVSLAKKAQVSLEKARVADIRCRVGLILDASGSMNGQYKRGRVQEVVNRLLPMAVQWDDDGALDCWAFGDYPQQLSMVTLENYSDFINADHGGWKNWELGARVNSEWRVIEQAIAHYQSSADRSPVFILFISDGGIYDSKRITRLIRDASSLPIFWQFIGIAGSNYGILEKLDDLDGRQVDNCNFFALDDLHQISEEVLYDRMMEEFPGWLKDARSWGIVT